MNKFPNWLRWLLFLPLSIIVSILVYVLVKLVSQLFDNFFLFQLLLILPGSGLTGYIFVAGAAFLVPKLKMAVSILMALSYGFLSWLIFIEKAILGNLVQLNSFEMICLTVVGTMAALLACHHGYVNQKKISQELIDLERENQLRKDLEKDSKASDSNSDILEDSIFQIITEFDTAAAKPRRKLIGQEKEFSRLSIPGRSSNIYQNDSRFQNVKEDIFISDQDSDDLEKEISQLMNVLDADIGEPGTKLVSKQDLLSRSARTTRRFDVQPDSLSEQKLMKKKHVLSPASRELDHQISQTMSDLERGKKVVPKKTTPKHSQSSEPVELDKSSDSLNGDVVKKDLKKEKHITVEDFRRKEGKVLQARLKPVPERIKSKRDHLPKKEEKHVTVSDLKVSVKKKLEPPVEPVPEIRVPKHEVSPKYDQWGRTGELDKSSDTLKGGVPKQDLKPEKQVAAKGSRDKKKKVLRPRLKPILERIESKRNELSKKQDKRVPEPEQKKLAKKPLQQTVESGLKIKESRREALPKREQISGPGIIKKTSNVLTGDLPSKRLEDKKYVPEAKAPDSEKKLKKAASELNVVPEKAKTEQSLEDDALISLTELEQLIEYYQDDLLIEKAATVEDIPEQPIKESGEEEFQDVVEIEPDVQEPQSTIEMLVTDSHESDKLVDADQDESFLQEFEEEDRFSYLSLDDLDEPIIQTTTELDILINESRTNQFMKYVEHYYKSLGEDENVALIHTQIFYLWCMMETVFEFSMDSEFRRNLIMFFNTRVGDLYLKWKEFTHSDTTKKISIDFNNFSYYSNQVRTNNIHLNSSFQNADAEILFGKIVLTKIHECMGNKKVDVERETILMPVQVYYELKQRVIEILNRTTNTICY